MDLINAVSLNDPSIVPRHKSSLFCRSIESQTDDSLSSISYRRNTGSICKSMDGITVSLLDHAPSSVQSIDLPSPRTLLLEIPEYKYLKVLQAFQEKHVFELAHSICTTKCRYCNPNAPDYDIFTETKKLSLPTPNETMFWDSLQRCKLRNQWGHWPQVYQIIPKFKRRQLALTGL